MNDRPALLHNMSAPPKSLVKYEGLSDFVIRRLPGGSGVTSVGYKPYMSRFICREQFHY